MATSRVPVEGGQLEVVTSGSGPGVVVVHGSGVAATDYERLAAALSARATVHLYTRRGRAGGPPIPTPYRVEDDVADLAAVLARTGATAAFGHSYGGYVVLRAALAGVSGLAAFALYDATVPVDGLLPSAFLAPMADAVDRGDLALAFARLSQGLQTAGALSSLPIRAQTFLGRGFLATPIGRRMGAMFPSIVAEGRAAFADDGPAARYAAVTVPTLLATGARSPAYLGRAADALAAQLPGARRLVLPRASHNAPNIARPSFVAPFTAFLTEHARPA